MKRLVIAALMLLMAVSSASCKSASGVGADNSAEPGVLQSASSPALPSASETSSETSGDQNVIMLVGTIGELPVHMSLNISDGVVTGSYYYDKVRKELKLKGTIEADRMLYIDEFDEKGECTGKFDGWYTHGIRYTGSWTNAKTDEKLDFSLKVIGGIPANAVWAGEWRRIDTGRFESATLVIYNETKSSFKFQMDAFSGSHMGFIDGSALIDGTEAYFKDLGTTGDFPPGAELTFILKDGIISVTANDAANGHAGMGVVFDGKYKEEPLPEATLFTQGYLINKEQDSAFRMMAGEDYDLFLDTAHMGTETEDLDDYGASVHNWWVRGLAGYSESIVMLLPDGKLCAAVIDHENSVLKVYTNAKYITEIPRTVQAWIADRQELLGLIADMPVRFHNSAKN